MILISYWDDDHGGFIAREIDNIQVLLDDESIDQDEIVAFGDVTAARLIQLSAWASSLFEEATVGIAATPAVLPNSLVPIDGIPGVQEYMGESYDDDERPEFVPPEEE